MIRKWFIARKEETRHQNGYDYARTEYENDPTEQNLLRLMNEQEDEFGHRSFNLGMMKALSEIIIERKELIN